MICNIQKLIKKYLSEKYSIIVSLSNEIKLKLTYLLITLCLLGECGALLEGYTLATAIIKLRTKYYFIK